jgi:hypothetical protein
MRWQCDSKCKQWSFHEFALVFHRIQSFAHILVRCRTRTSAYQIERQCQVWALAIGPTSPYTEHLVLEDLDPRRAICNALELLQRLEERQAALLALARGPVARGCPRQPHVYNALVLRLRWLVLHQVIVAALRTAQPP